MNTKEFRKMALAWWSFNKGPIVSESIPNMKTLLQFYISFQDAEAFQEDPTKDLAFALLKGIPGNKKLSWDAIVGYMWDDIGEKNFSDIIDFFETMRGGFIFEEGQLREK